MIDKENTMATNTPIYYSTAQVTDMVELSDQNVRKYFRMLEERGYEVTRDEYQRRLFSKADVHVLQEMIKVSKEPGFTLELAADEVIEKADEIIEKNKEETNNSASNDDVLKALRLVVDKLEEMRQENIELHQNIKTLVTRLDSYDENLLDTKEQQQLLESEVTTIKEDLNKSAEKIESDTKTLEDLETTLPKEEEKLEETETIEAPVEETKEEVIEKTDSEEQTEGIQNNKDSFDMSTYEEKAEDIEETEDVEEAPKVEEEKEETSEVEEKNVTFEPEKKKKGFFARLFGG